MNPMSSKKFFFLFLASLVALFLFKIYIATPFMVFGQSMEPSFHDKEYIWVERITPKLGKIKRGDVVIIKNPTNPSVSFIKRVIALPNERIEIIAGKVKIYNLEHPEGFFLAEPYVIQKDKRSMPLLGLGEDEYFVMGDNRPDSYDSRNFGPIKKRDIIGKPLFKFAD